MSREIKAYPTKQHYVCSCCGKNKSRRKEKSPAPVRLIIGKEVFIQPCMACAKKTSDRLDRAIQRIESGYAIKRDVCRKLQGKAELGNTCLTTPGTCESCPDWARGVSLSDNKGHQE